jgi:hypothetical protein
MIHDHLVEQLVLEGVADSAVISRAIRSRQSHGGSLAQHLALHGVLPSNLVAEYFARKYHLERVELMALDQVGMDVWSMLPVEVISEAGLVPLSRESQRTLIAGWIDPTEPGRIEEAEFFSGYVVEPRILSLVEFSALFERLSGYPWRVSWQELASNERLVEHLRDDRTRIFGWLDELAVAESDIEPASLQPQLKATVSPRQTMTSEEAIVARGDAYSLVDLVPDGDGSAEIRLEQVLPPDSMKVRSEAMPTEPSVRQRERSRNPTPTEVNVDTRAREEHEFLSTSLPVGQVSVARPARSGPSRDTMDESMMSSSGSRPHAPRMATRPSPAHQPASVPPPVATRTGDSESTQASLTTGTFQVPTAEMIERKRGDQKAKTAQPYYSPPTSGESAPTASDSDPEESLELAEVPSAPASRRPVMTTGSLRVAGLGSFGRPTRIFDSTGQALGVTRAAFRTVVKGLDASDAREDIAREIIEGLSLIFSSAILLTIRRPGFVVWRANQWEGSPLVAGSSVDLEEGSLWARIVNEGVAYRGRLPDQDPLRGIMRAPLGLDTLVAPLTMNRRTIALLVLDGGAKGELPGIGAQFEPFDASVTGAFRRMILNKKRPPQWHNS